MSTEPREYPSRTSRQAASAPLEGTWMGFLVRAATCTWPLNSSIWALEGDTSEYFGSSPTSPTPSASSHSDANSSSARGFEAASEGCTPRKHFRVAGCFFRSARLGDASAGETHTEASRLPLHSAPDTTSSGSG